jgi:signal transduction histidine kinase
MVLAARPRPLVTASSLAPGAVAAVVATLAVARAGSTFDTGSGGDGVWLVVDLAASWVVAGWGALRVLDDRRDGAGYLLQCSGLSWALAALCDSGALFAGSWLPFGGGTDEVQVAAHLLARSLLIAAVIIVLPDREADGFLRRGAVVAATAGVTVGIAVALGVQPLDAVLRDTPFGFGNRVWIEAGTSLPRPVLALMVAVEAAALVALHRTRRGLPPTSFQVIGWGLVAVATPLAVPGADARMPTAVTDVLAVLVYPALPVVSVIALLRSAAAVARTMSSLRSAQNRLVDAVETERRRLRQELHDGLGPALAGIALGVRAAGRQVGDGDRATAALLDQLASEAETCLEEVRRIVYDLRPPALDQLGLRGAITALAQRCCEGDGAPLLALGLDDCGEMPAAVELATYRIVAEALTNVVRHAHASAVEVSIHATKESVIVEVADDGSGLPADLPAGVGLTSMRDRASAVGGTLTIGTGPYGGTCVRASLPVGRR